MQLFNQSIFIYNELAIRIPFEQLITLPLEIE